MKKFFVSVIMLIILLTMSAALVGCQPAPDPAPPCACPPVLPEPEIPDVQIAIKDNTFVRKANDYHLVYWSKPSGSDYPVYGEVGVKNYYGTWGMMYIEIANNSDSVISILDFVLSYDGKVLPAMSHTNNDRIIYLWDFAFDTSPISKKFDMFLSSTQHVMPNSTISLVVTFNIPRISETEYYAADTTKYTVHALQKDILNGKTTQLDTAVLDLTAKQ